MAVGSIVDYLNSRKQDSSYNNRKKLANQYGINNYSGTAAQNTSLLKAMQGSGSPPASSADNNTCLLYTSSYCPATPWDTRLSPIASDMEDGFAPS